MRELTAYKHIHCIGIGGIGLSAIAEIFLSRGYRVSGSDMKENDRTDALRNSGATITIGHDASNIKGVDLLIYTAAISPDNPELNAAKEAGIDCVTRAEALGALMSEYRFSIAVSGTHGKTTTTAMVSLILKHALLEPTILVGGNLDELNGNAYVGKSEYFVTEACEYMDSFLSLRPRTEIILNIDSDHLDYFKDIDHIVRSFHRFAELVPQNGTIIAYSGNPFVQTVINDCSCDVITFGFDERCDYYAKDIRFNESGMPGFSLCRKGAVLCRLQLSIPGEHNIANALAAAACCLNMNIPMESIKSTLEAFTGTQRRFDVIGVSKEGIRLVDDYAHHPTEIKATLSAASKLPHESLWCIFQPHTYTRTLALFNDFASAFEKADKVILTDIYAAREKNIYKISSRELAAEMKRTHPGKEIYYIADFNEIANFVSNNAERGDLILTMGAGDVYKVAELILGRS